ncbi:glycosyltransferase family 2 protein [Oscillatoria amoena NRMC-F 0135]|nr:glycosyltransferase family 2 protein [Oscillatoria laete-virens]MDL5047209.1 glycosyltransferase family 2 protein [Oscillatoria amoena NRMC-F 0135]MDL5055459.1 glycosyltransferase family 2 protein [Oscillatoria laete-virens NRMC-F 0139]
MKLIIQIPCYNEADSLPVTLKELPRQVEGFDRVEWLIIDDGSIDKTVQIARELGVDHIISHHTNQGLAKAFMTGLNACISAGADVIVNTDADNQYYAGDIPSLVSPILQKKAEIVIGARPIQTIEHFSPIKKSLQRIGSWAVAMASNTRIPDAPSGFRAYTRSAAMRMVVFNDYTYTLETIIQAGQNNMAIDSVPVRVNKDLRESRLVKSIPAYIQKGIFTIVRIFAIYRPFSFFGIIGGILFLVGFLIGCRFLYFYFIGNGEGHIQSLILVAILLVMGFHTILVAFLADILSANRKLLEEIRYQQKLNNSHNKESDNGRSRI